MAGIAPGRAGRPHRPRAARPARRGGQGGAEAAIAAGGSSLRDYVRPDGELGYFSKDWRVYGREGEPVPLRRQDSPPRQLGPLDLLLPEMPALNA